jgi:hypothetical protein
MAETTSDKAGSEITHQRSALDEEFDEIGRTIDSIRCSVVRLRALRPGVIPDHLVDGRQGWQINGSQTGLLIRIELR